MDNTIFNNIVSLKHSTLKNFRKEITAEAISYLESQKKSNDQEHNQLLDKKINYLNKACESNVDADYPIDISAKKQFAFLDFSVKLDTYKSELLSSLPSMMKIEYNPDTLKNILSEKKCLWYQPIDCYFSDLKWLGPILKVPIAFLVKNLDFPDDFELIDENGNIVYLNNLIISDIDNFDNINSNSINNRAKFIFKYFKKIYGAPIGCTEETWSNENESAYNTRFLNDLKVLSNYISLLPIHATNGTTSSPELKTQKFTIPKELVLSKFLNQEDPAYYFEMYFNEGSTENLFSYLTENPVYAKVLYILKLYTLCKTTKGSNINALNTIRVSKKEVNGTDDTDIESPIIVRKNLDTILKILFDTITPDTVKLYSEKYKFTDNNSFSSYYTGGSGNGYIFDELYALLLLNIQLSAYDILLFQFIWQSRIYAEQLTILSATDASLNNYTSVYIKQWIIRTIAMESIRQYQYSIPNYLPLPPVYCLGKMHLLHCNKHTAFTQYLKSSVLRLFNSHLDKYSIPYRLDATSNDLLQNQFISTKSHMNKINTLFGILKTNIANKLPIYLALFQNAVRQVNLNTNPLYKNLLKEHKNDSILSLIDQLPELRLAIFPKPLSDELNDAKNIEEGLKYIYPFILNYPSDFKHTKDSQVEFIYVACIALYISCNYLLPSDMSHTIDFKQKDIIEPDDKNIRRIKSISDLFSKNKGKNCYKLLYPLSSSYVQNDLIRISKNLGMVKILDIPSLYDKPEQLKRKSIKGTDITLIKSITAFYVILFASKLYSDNPKEFFKSIKEQSILENKRGADYAFKDIHDMLDIYRVKY
jgi:hypothetical protein